MESKADLHQQALREDKGFEHNQVVVKELNRLKYKNKRLI